MRSIRLWCVVPVIMLGLVAATAAAQPRNGDDAVVVVGGDQTVPAGTRVDDVVAIAGSATVEGEVDSDAVAVMGDITLASTARVEGDLVVVLGSAAIEPGAEVDGDLVVVLGGLDAPPGFRPGGEQVVIGAGRGPGSAFGAVTPWFREGLFWGRPLVPGLAWTWVVAALFLVIYLVVNLVFVRPVRACTEVLNEKPLTTGLGGLLVLLLIGPVSVVLAISVVGLIVIPFLICAVLLAGLVGRVAVARWMGSRVLAEDDPESWQQGSRSVLIGAVLIGVAYLVPLLGFVTWTVLGVFGLGAAATIIVAALQRENPPQSATGVRAAEPPVETPEPAAPDSEPEQAVAAAEEHARPALPPVMDTPSDLSAYPRAGFGIRLGALALDVLLLGISAALLNAEDGWFFLLVLAYHIGLWAWKGTTIGGIVCHLRVVRPDGQPVGFTEALVRGLSAIFSVAVAGLGWFWMLWDPERQTWHDKIAGTIVVRVPASVTLP